MKNKARRWIYIFSGIVFVLIFVIVQQLLNVKIDKSNYSDLNNDWNIQINNKVYENVSLQDFMFESTSKGDFVKIKQTLPEKNIIKNPVLRMYSVHSVVKVLYNDTVCYEYGTELKKEKKLLGYGYHFVHIPEDYAGKELQIIFDVTENDAFSSITVPQICNNDVVQRDFVIQNRLPLAINLFLVVFGVLLMVISFIFCFKYRQFAKLICVGGFSVGIGMWSLCNYDLIILFTYKLQLKSYLEYASLYIAPLFVILYFWGDTFITRYKITKITYFILLGAQALFVLAAFILQVANIIHFPDLLKIQHIIILVIVIFVFLIAINDFIKKQLSNRFLIIGMLMMLFIGFCDLINFFVTKYGMVSKEVHYTSSICVGAMIFVISQLTEFGAEIGDILLQGARTKLLEQMAYVDEMTGLIYRRRCEEIWDSFEEGESNYGIFSFDLNYLKKTNDTKGHAKGDLLIKSLAQVLLNVFGDVGVVGRIGGDEYIVFIEDINGIELGTLTQKLEDELKRVNVENPDLNLSTAYGFCSHEQYPDMDSRHIYRKADALMYEMKEAMKAVRMD